MTSGTRFGVVVGIAAVVVALAGAASASALYVKGHQVQTGAEKYDMTGGLVGEWKITSFHIKHTSPVFKGKGTEHFAGCIDAARDGSCVGDPTGTLDFRFRYWARFTESGDAVELGTCAHRITAGSGGLFGATGFLMMVDTPIPGGGGATTTHYEGEIDGTGLAPKAPASAPSC